MTDIHVIERLSRINPVPEDPAPAAIGPLLERLEDPRIPVRGRPEFPHGETRPRWRRSFVLGGGLAAVVVGAVTLVALLAAPDGGTPNVAAAMYKATTPGSGVLHMSTVTERFVGDQTRVTREQFWSEQNPRRVHLIITDSEETLESALTTSPLNELQWSQSKPDVIEQSVPAGVSDTEQTGVEILRELYRKGEVTLAGKSTFDGQPAWLLEVHPTYARPTLHGQPLPSPTVTVSASSFVPLELVESSVTSESGKPELLVTKTRYLAYEELPPNTQDEALLTLAPHPGASVKSEG
jgi:hypothetical protein